MKRNIDSTTTPDIWHLTDAEPVLEIYANQDFDNSENQRILAGDPQYQNFYRAITCSVVDGQLVVPIVEDIDTTEDSPDNQRATYSAYLRASNQPLIEWLLAFRIPPSTTTPVSSIDWTSLRIHKSGIVQREPLTTYTREEIDALIETKVQIAIGTLNDAGVFPTGPKGRTWLSKLPALPTEPIALSFDDYAAVGHNGVGRPSVAPEDADEPIWTGTNDRRVTSCIYNVRSYGAAGNGIANDRTAIQEAIDDAKADSTGHVEVPPGTYNVGTPLSLLEIKGVGFHGAGPDHTTIVATGGQPAVQCNGIWRSLFEGIRFLTSAAISGAAVFELDGNYDLSHTQGVQGNRFVHCIFGGQALADYAFAHTRQGAGAAQGDHDEFDTCYFAGGLQACYYQNGFNALKTLLQNCDFQDYPKNGIKLEAGSLSMYDGSFQSLSAYTQILNGGYDVDMSTSGVYDEVVFDSVRSESLRFLNAGASQKAIVRGFNYTPAAQYTWAANTLVTLNTIIFKTAPNGSIRMYRVTTAGVSGGTQPVWPNSGTVADGTAVWTLTALDIITMSLGSFEDYTGYVGLSRAGVVQNFPAWNVALSENVRVASLPPAQLQSDFLASQLHEVFLVDATLGNRVVTLPTLLLPGKRYVTKKYDTSANTVTTTGGPNAIDLAGDAVIPGGSRGYVELVGMGGFLSPAYYIIGKSY